MTVLFIGNTPVDVGVTAAQVSTLTLGRDPAYSPYSLLCDFINPTIAIPVDAGTSFWFHFRMYGNAISDGSGVGAGPIFRCVDGAGVQIFDVYKNTNGHDSYLRVNGSATVNGAVMTFVSANTYTMDFKVTVGGSGGTIVVEVYQNGVLVSAATATNSGTVKTQPRQFYIDFPSRVAGAALGFNFTEFLVTSDEPTIGARVATLDPSSAGFYAAMSGAVADLADFDSVTGVASNANGQRFNAVMSAYAGPANPAGVRGIFLKSNAAQSGGAPYKLNQGFRIGGVNYDGVAKTVVTGTPTVHEFVNNPATSAPWLAAALAALEVGLLSAP